MGKMVIIDRVHVIVNACMENIALPPSVIEGTNCFMTKVSASFFLF